MTNKEPNQEIVREGESILEMLSNPELDDALSTMLTEEQGSELKNYLAMRLGAGYVIKMIASTPRAMQDLAYEREVDKRYSVRVTRNN